MPTTSPVPLPPLADQAATLVQLGVHAAAGIEAEVVHAAARHESPGALLVLRDAAPSALAPLMSHNGRPGFVVEDMTDVDRFTPHGVDPPGAIYLVHGIDRGDDLRNQTPDETYPVLTARGHTPLTLVEGLHLLLQRPELLEPNHCFMTTASRLRKDTGRLDSRTPALWISGGTGRDGRERRGAPKVGWCWAGNRHTWLGIASAEARSVLPGADGAA